MLVDPLFFINLLVRDVTPVILVRSHFSTRIKQHTLTDKNSHVFKLLNCSSNCETLFTSDFCKILDSAKRIDCLN